MTTKEQAKAELKKIIEDFKLNYSKYKGLSEADVETKLIEVLFIDILGWDKGDFIKQQQVRRGDNQGRADYAFKIGDKTVFYLEVKKVGISLDKEADKQVISYALSKRVPFAISTNFEQMKIFCVEEGDETKRVFRVFSKPEEYLEKLQDLLLLTKESFKQDLLLKEAIKEERLKKRISIDKPLLEDLMYIRKLISDDLEKRYSEKYNINEKDEIIQRIIDRLIFIRRCEDIGINPNDIKLEELRHLPQNKTYPRLKEIFKVYNDVYNSGLFAPAKDNDCDNIDINGKIIQDLAYLLYESKDKKYIYNFDWIDADVLGQVYEQYLGKILQQTKSGKAKLKEGQAHRKEQGIYYTPTYIVDYIVKNTLGELLKDKKIKAKDIKILDPACGSGSFLIKAFDYLNENLVSDKKNKQEKLNFDNFGYYSIKTDVLKNNIYGVDLDNRAVEITKLNLLLKAAEKNRKLPEEVDVHIKHGNSLIDDESVAGLDAFKWTGDFKEGSFDVVIGNPPYIRQEEIKEYKPYLEKSYEIYTGTSDIYVYFFERALKLLKEGGLFGFIVSNKFARTKYGQKLRAYILKNTSICAYIDKFDNKVFEDATVDPCIIILQKQKIKNNSFFYNYKTKINQSDLSDDVWAFSNKENLKIKEKIDKTGIPLKNWNIKIKFGIKTGFNKAFLIDNETKERLCKEDTKNKEIIKPVLRGRDIRKYTHQWEKLWLINSHNGLKSKDIKRIDIEKEYPSIFKYLKQFEKELKKRQDKGEDWTNLRNCAYLEDFDKEKIIWSEIVRSPQFYYDQDKFFIEASAFFMVGEHLKYITGLLNSKLLSFAFKNFYSGGGLGKEGFRYKKVFLEKLPLAKPLESKEKIINLVDKMLSLNKKLNGIGNKQTSETAKIKQEMEKTDKEIDEIVYKIYNITEEEKKIIEENLK